MSVIPNLTIYGDVSPKQINQGLLTSKFGLSRVINRKAIATSEKQLALYTEDHAAKLMLPKAMTSKELMIASGMVGLNKPFRAPIYRTYWECIKGLYN